MRSGDAQAYPPDAYSDDGVLWWALDTWPGKRRRFGDERKLAAWLAFNIEVGETFTMRQLRAELGDVVPNDAEHLNRRLRNLRPDGWSIPSNLDDGNLRIGEYRLEVIGWHPGIGEQRPGARGVSQGVRRRVFERDNRRCVICGVAGGEQYEDGAVAALTIGHRHPSARRGSSVDLTNLQTECRRCNQPARDEVALYESLADLLPELRTMNRAEKTKLESWLLEGRRTRDRTDEMYDRLRRLTVTERADAEVALRRMLGNG